MSMPGPNFEIHLQTYNPDFKMPRRYGIFALFTDFTGVLKFYDSHTFSCQASIHWMTSWQEFLHMYLLNSVFYWVNVNQNIKTARDCHAYVRGVYELTGLRVDHICLGHLFLHSVLCLSQWQHYLGFHEGFWKSN